VGINLEILLSRKKIYINDLNPQEWAKAVNFVLDLFRTNSVQLSGFNKVEEMLNCILSEKSRRRTEDYTKVYFFSSDRDPLDSKYIGLCKYETGEALTEKEKCKERKSYLLKEDGTITEWVFHYKITKGGEENVSSSFIPLSLPKLVKALGENAPLGYHILLGISVLSGREESGRSRGLASLSEFNRRLGDILEKIIPSMAFKLTAPGKKQ